MFPIPPPQEDDKYRKEVSARALSWRRISSHIKRETNQEVLEYLRYLRAHIRDLKTYTGELERAYNAQAVVIDNLNRQIAAEREKIKVFTEDTEVKEIAVSLLDPISQDLLQKTTILLSNNGCCGHLFSFTSIAQWASSGMPASQCCPVCRQPFTDICMLPLVDEFITALIAMKKDASGDDDQVHAVKKLFDAVKVLFSNIL
eukprot:137969_1